MYRPDSGPPIQFSGILVGVPYFNPRIDGREALLTKKVGSLLRGKDVRLSIVGEAGIGKTAFAVAIARDPRVLNRFRDGTLWINLGVNSEPALMIARWAKMLNIDLAQNATFDSRIRAIQRVICQREFLIVFDDVSNLEYAYRLSCNASRCALIVISANPDIGKSFSGNRYSVELTGLDTESSMGLVNSVCGDGRMPLFDQLSELVLACEGNPLLLRRGAAFLRLSQEKRLSASIIDAHAPASHAFSNFLEGLRACSDEKQKLFYITSSILDLLPSQIVTNFYHLGVFSSEPQQFDCDAAMQVCGAKSSEIQTLIDLKLVSAEGNRFWLSKDINEYLLSHTSIQASKSHRDYYLTRMASAIGDQEDAHALYSQLKRSFQFHSEDQYDPSLFGLIAERLAENGLWDDYLVIGEKTLQFAKLNGQQDGLAGLFTSLAKVYSILNQKEKALEYYNQALTLLRQLDNPTEKASILNNIGTIYAYLSQNENALQYLQEAQRIAVGLSDIPLEANIYNNLGSVELNLGHVDQAIKIISHAADLIPYFDDEELKHRIHFNFAMALYSKGDLKASIVQFQQVVEIDRKRADPDYELDKGFLFDLEKELAMPKFIRWMRRTIFSFVH